MSTAVAAWEALYIDAEKSARLDWNYLTLVVLSTLVAAIGLMEDRLTYGRKNLSSNQAA